MHPTDLMTDRADDTTRVSRTAWWALVALVVVLALLVTAVLTLSRSESELEPTAPQPTEAPLEPGV